MFPHNWVAQETRAVLIWNGNPDLAAPQTEWKNTSNFVKSAEDFSDVERQEEDSH
jgi:hypothetical protein